MKEIFRLKEMLEKAKIPFEFFERKLFNGHQITYPDDNYRICSIIQNEISYGHEVNRLEIMGLFTEEEKKYDFVVGNLTAEEVFERIEKHYKENRN